MNINGLMNLAGPQLSTAASQPGAAKTLDPQAASVVTPAAVYHGSTPSSSEPLPTYDMSGVQVWMFDHAAWEKADKEMRELWFNGGFSVPLADMRHAYDAAMARLSPELAAKDWGFSIRNDRLVIVTGDDTLSEHELATLEEALRGLETPAKTLASNVIRYLELDRGTDGLSKRLGRFDVSQDNFDRIIDMRELLLSHAEQGKYGRGAVEPNNYRKLYGTAGYAIVDQIVARAEERFLARSPQHYQTRVY